MDIGLLSDDELWNRTKALAGLERAATCDLVEHLVEIDKRGLSERRMHVSLFEFCVHHLRLSEEAAYRRIRAARAVRKFPPISAMLRDGKLTLENVALLHPFLNDPDAGALVTRCIGLRKWQVQALLAGRQTEKPRRDVIRYCGPVVEKIKTVEEPAASLFVPPSAQTSTPSSALVRQCSSVTVSTPLPASSRPRTIRVTFSADDEFYKLMLRARALLRHKYPDGRLEGVLKDALVALLKRKDRGFGWERS